MATRTTRSFAGREADYYRNSDGATAAGATAIGAAAVGALAVGAMAIGALAIGRLAVRKARIGSLDIGELRVRKIRQAGDGGAIDTVPAAADTETRAIAGAWITPSNDINSDTMMLRIRFPYS